MLKKLLAVLAMLYAAASFAAVDVNTASAADLDSVKGIGPDMSGKIVKERKKGQFKDWNDLISRVKGMGEKNAAKFSAEGMTVNGAGFKGAAAAPTAKKEDKPMAAAAPAAPAAKKDDKPMAAPAAATTTTAAAKPAADAKADKKADAKVTDQKDAAPKK